MTRIYLLIFCVAMTGVVRAQLSESDTAYLAVNASLSGRLNTGNIERLLVTPELNLTHQGSGRTFGIASGQRYAYGTFGKQRTESDLLSRNFIYLHPGARVYPFAMLWFQTHERQRLRFRYQAGAGATCALVRRAAHHLKLSLTATWEENTYREGNLTQIVDPGKSAYSVARGTVRVAGNHLFGAGLLNLFYEGYFQQALTDGRNWRVYAEGGFNVRVIYGFGVRVFSSFEYQTVHVARERPQDLIVNFGLTYRHSRNKFRT